MKALEILCKDPKMANLVSSVPQNALHVPGQKSEIREYLVGSIISQQLSVKVAKVIKQRFLELFENRFPTNPEIISKPNEDLRAAGLSNSKTSYIKNIALFFEERQLHRQDWNALTDDEIIELLTQIKGVGRWTAEMVLMFGLCRPDVFSPGDYGIQQSMIKLYKLKEEGKALQSRMCRIAEKWRPYRTTACLYLWAWKDQV